MQLQSSCNNPARLSACKHANSKENFMQLLLSLNLLCTTPLCPILGGPDNASCMCCCDLSKQNPNETAHTLGPLPNPLKHEAVKYWYKSGSSSGRWPGSKSAPPPAWCRSPERRIWSRWLSYLQQQAGQGWKRQEE
jgi:hypothetical protein